MENIDKFIEENIQYNFGAGYCYCCEISADNKGYGNGHIPIEVTGCGYALGDNHLNLTIRKHNIDGKHR